MQADRGVFDELYAHLPHDYRKRSGGCGGRKPSKKMQGRKRRAKKKARMARKAEASRVNRQVQRRQILGIAKATEQETTIKLRRRLVAGIRDRLRRGAFTVE